MDGGSSILGSKSTAEITRSYRSHSEAERKRRQRINGHLATLRALLPAAARMDKATLLGEVVRHVRELHGLTADVALAVPTEGDEVRVEEDRGKLRACVCCPDRPGLMGELSRAIGSVRSRAVRAEIATVGGRTKTVLELELGKEESRSALQSAFRAVLIGKGPGSVDSVGENYKRQRLATRFIGK